MVSGNTGLEMVDVKLTTEELAAKWQRSAALRHEARDITDEVNEKRRDAQKRVKEINQELGKLDDVIETGTEKRKVKVQYLYEGGGPDPKVFTWRPDTGEVIGMRRMSKREEERWNKGELFGRPSIEVEVPEKVPHRAGPDEPELPLDGGEVKSGKKSPKNGEDLYGHEHEYQDGVCEHCGEADPEAKPAAAAPKKRKGGGKGYDTRTGAH